MRTSVQAITTYSLSTKRYNNNTMVFRGKHVKYFTNANFYF